MLIIEIALGIVLGVVILTYWRELINFGIIGVLGIVAFSVLGFGGYYFYENFDSLTPFIDVIIFLSLFFGSLIIIKAGGEKISGFTLKKWNLSSGDIAGIIFYFSIFGLGIFFLGKAILASENSDILSFITLGSVIVLVGIVGGLIHIREIKRTRGLRAIRASYE